MSRGDSKIIFFAGDKFRAGKVWWFFFKLPEKNLMGFFGRIGKYNRNKGNGAEGTEDFWWDKFRAGKICWEFLVIKFVH